MLKKLFQRRDDSANYTAEDLIVLERWADARVLLEQRVKSRPKDVRAKMHLAHVYAEMNEGEEAVIMYRQVASAYTEDGFPEKALAVLKQARRLRPDDPEINRRIYHLQETKGLEETQAIAKEALREALREQSGETNLGNVNIRVEQLWGVMIKSQFVRTLPEAQIRPFLSAVVVADFQRDEPLAKGGTKAPELILVVDGSVEARAEGGLVLRSFGRGDILGESTLFEHRTWPSTMVAVQPTMTLRLDRKGLEKALTGNDNPRELINCLRQQGNDQMLRDMLEKAGTKV